MSSIEFFTQHLFIRGEWFGLLMNITCYLFIELLPCVRWGWYAKKNKKKKQKKNKKKQEVLKSVSFLINCERTICHVYSIPSSLIVSLSSIYI